MYRAYIVNQGQKNCKVATGTFLMRLLKQNVGRYNLQGA